MYWNLYQTPNRFERLLLRRVKTELREWRSRDENCPNRAMSENQEL